MRIDDLTSAPGASVPLLASPGPAQRAITQFLAVHRTLPERSRCARTFGRSPLPEASAPWYWRAVGQLSAAAALDGLGPEWRVFHGVLGPAADPGDEVTWIDHLAIGPSGVFTVTAYDHTRQNVWVGRRAFVIDGHRVQYIRLAEAEVGHVERMLGAATGSIVTAGAIIALIDPGSLRVRDLPRDVWVIEANALAASLRAGERQLGAERVQQLADAVNLEGTWPGRLAVVAAAELQAGAADRAGFARVRREVATARFVRAAWMIGVAGLLAGVLVAIGILQLVSIRTVGV